MNNQNSAINVDLALIHYPVWNKNKQVIGSAVTNLDIHDIARAGLTFGVNNFYIVTPYEDQQQMVQELMDHWLIGPGGEYNKKRKEALAIIRLCSDLATLYSDVTAQHQQKPTVLATCAQHHPQQVWSYNEIRLRINNGEHFLVLFGTAWGLTAEVIKKVDGLLPPIMGNSNYNHLSVRSAAAIVLDRLLSA